MTRAGEITLPGDRVVLVATPNGSPRVPFSVFDVDGASLGEPDAINPFVKSARDRYLKGMKGVDKAQRAQVKELLIQLSEEMKVRRLERPESKPQPTEPTVDPVEARERAKALVGLDDIPKRAARELAEMGVAGESAQLELLYLVLTSRVLDPPLRPVSVVVKSLSAAGKSYLVDRSLQLFPARAFYFMTSMSERALVYDTEPLAHRMLVIAEATGMEGEMQQLIIRSLLSEGKLVYLYVDKDEKNQLKTFRAERAGPTGLILTTTRAAVHPENETRLLSLSVTESVEQTRAVFHATAKRVKGEGKASAAHDLSQWHALQEWISVAEHRVEIPYLLALADTVNCTVVRMRRDFTTVLALISARAILHQVTRERDAEGKIIATFEDYETVAGLIGELVSHGIQTSVPPKVRKVVEAVAARCQGPREDRDPSPTFATAKDVAAALDVEKSAAHAWITRATHDGYLVNIETRRRQPAKLTLGDPLPSDTSALPTREQLETAFRFRNRSGSEVGTPSVAVATTTDSVPAFRGDSPPSAEKMHAERHNLPATMKVSRNAGTAAQVVDSVRDGVPALQTEPIRNRNAGSEQTSRRFTCAKCSRKFFEDPGSPCFICQREPSTAHLAGGNGAAIQAEGA